MKRYFAAYLIAFYVPMHTATRLAARMIPEVRGLNSSAHIVAYGLYAPMNEVYLRHLGVQTVLGGEFEEGLTALAQRLERGVEAMPGEQPEPRISVARQDFVIPIAEDFRPRRVLQVRLPNGDRRTAGYGGEPRLQTPVPALSGGASLQWPVSHHPSRNRP